MTDERFHIPLTFAADPATPAEILTVLARDLAFAPIVAANPAAPGDLLEELAKTPNNVVRRAVAGNPNTPLPLLLHLAVREPEAFLANPVLPLLLIEDPDLARQMNFSTRQYLLQFADMPAPLLQSLVSQAGLYDDATMHIKIKGEAGSNWEDEAGALLAEDLLKGSSLTGRWPQWLVHAPNWLLLALRRTQCYLDLYAQDKLDPTLPSPDFAFIVRSRDVHTRWLAAQASTMPIELLTVQAADSASSVREAVAANPATPVTIQQHMAQHAPPTTSQKLALHPDVSPAILATLMDRQIRDEAYHAALQHPRLPIRYVAPAVASNRWEDRRDIARSSPHLTFAQCEQLARDPNGIVRQTLALNPNVPPPILAMLAEDPDWKIRANVAFNWSTPPSLIGLLSLDPHHRVAADAVTNPHITPGALALSLTRSGGPPQGLEAHPRTPVAVLEHLARYGNHAQRCEVARNPSTPTYLLEELAKYQKKDDTFSRNQQIQQRQMYIAERQQLRLRISLAQNPRLPLALLEQLAQLHDWDVVATLASHPTLTPELLAILMRDIATLGYIGHLPAQAALLANPQTPAEALGDCLFWADDRGNLRYAPLWFDVLAHPNTPADTLGRLIQQEDVIVHLPNRELLLGLMPLAPALFERYSRSPKWSERYAVAHNPHTPAAVLRRLAEIDGNRYVRAAARAGLEQFSRAQPPSSD